MPLRSFGHGAAFLATGRRLFTLRWNVVEVIIIQVVVRPIAELSAKLRHAGCGRRPSKCSQPPPLFESVTLVLLAKREFYQKSACAGTRAEHAGAGFS